MNTWLYNYADHYACLKILIGWLWEKRGVVGGSSRPLIVLVTKWWTTTAISVWASPLSILYEHWFDTITLTKKNKQTNKHIHDLSSGKNYTISHFFRWKLETLTVRFSDMPNLMVRFLLRFFVFLGALIGAFVVFRGVYRPLSKVIQIFSDFHDLWWVHDTR